MDDNPIPKPTIYNIVYKIYISETQIEIIHNAHSFIFPVYTYHNNIYVEVIFSYIQLQSMYHHVIDQSNPSIII